MKSIITVLAIFCFLNSYAQQDPLLTMYWNNYSLSNPAATAVDYKHYAAFIGRHQWSGYENGGEPRTISMAYNLKLDKFNSGLGVSYMNDQIGFMVNNIIKVNYSYQIQFKKERVLSAGVSFNFNRKSIDYSELNPIDPGDSYLPDEEMVDLLFDMNMGAFYQSPRLTLGVSMTNIFETKSDNLGFKNRRHSYVIVSYGLPIGKDLEIRPGALYKTDFSSGQFDINVRTIYKEYYSLGITYRISDNLSTRGSVFAFYAGVDLFKKFRIAYAYDYLSDDDLRDLYGASHEICLAFMIK